MATSSAMSTTNQYVKYTISVTENSQNIANNTTNVTVKVRFYRTNTGYTTYGSGTVYCKIDGTQYSASVSSSQGITNSGIVLFTKTLDIKHDDDGTKDLTCSAWINISGVVSSSEQSYTQTLTDIPRASELTASNGTLGTKQTLTIEKASDSFTHTIKYTCGTASGTIVTKTSEEEVDWTPPLSLASQNTSGTKVSVKLTITTYSGSTSVGSDSVTISCSIPASVKPTCSIAVSDAMGYASTYGAYVEGKSKFKVVVTGTPAYSSAIKTYKTVANGATYSKSSFTTGVLKDWGELTITSTVTDGRSRTGTDTETVTVLEYNDPVPMLEVTRANSDWSDNIEGECIKVNYGWTSSPLNYKNNILVKLRILKADGTETIEETLYDMSTVTDDGLKTYSTNNGASLWTDLDKDASYIFELSVTDDFTTITKTIPVSSAFTFLHFDGPTQDGTGKNKLNLMDDPVTYIDQNGKIQFTFNDDIYAMTGTGLTDELGTGMAAYTVGNINEGDVIRFNTVLLDPACRITVTVYQNATDSDGVYIADAAAAYNYTDGVTMIEFEHTATTEIMFFQVTFHLDYGDGGSDRLARFKRPIVTINEKDMTYERYIIGTDPRLGIGKIAELPNGVDFGLKVRLNEGFLYPILAENMNLNDVMAPNFYTALNATSANYSNCPVTSGTFYLEVFSAGDEDQIGQRLITCSKTNSLVYERFYFQEAWGDWRIISPYPIGSVYMSSSNTNPSTLFGGSWTLIDKEFSRLGDYDDDGTYFTMNETNLTSYGLYFVRSGKSINARLNFTNAVELNDNGITLGTLNFSVLGISRLYYSLIGVIGTTDGGDGTFICTVNWETGVITVTDVITKTSEGTIPAGSACYLLFEMPMHSYYMLDEKCNRFYWKRTA